MSTYPTIPFEPQKHMAAFLHFIEKVRGSEKFANRKQAYDWLHSDFPLMERSPLRFIVMDGERVAGSMGHLPADYMIKGEKTPVRITHDLLVDQDYRGKGLARQLVDNAISKGDFFPGGMWMTVPCYKIHRSCGFDDIVAPRTRTLILDPKAFALHQNYHFAKRAVAQKVLGVIRSRAVKKASATRKRSTGGLSLREIREFNSHLDGIWIPLLSSYDITACRDAAFLNWKYAHHPIVRYRILLAERNGKATGYLVWRLPYSREQKNRAVIVDYLVERGDAETFRAMVSAVILEASEKSVETLSIMTTQSWAVKLIKALGFLTSRGKHTWVVANWERYIPRDWLNNYDHWHICLGDSDGDYWAGGQ